MLRSYNSVVIISFQTQQRIFIVSFPYEGLGLLVYHVYTYHKIKHAMKLQNVVEENRMIQGSKPGGDYLNLAGSFPKEMKCRKKTNTIF